MKQSPRLYSDTRAGLTGAPHTLQGFFGFGFWTGLLIPF